VIASSNTAENMDVYLVSLSYVGSGLCDELITRSKDSYHVRACVYVRVRACLHVCDLET
jgi:hypothetical protein